MNGPAVQFHLSDTASGQAAHNTMAKSGFTTTINESCVFNAPSSVRHLGLRDPAVSEPYYRMAIPTSLPPPPNFNFTSLERNNSEPHTFHEMLLVLNYLFVSSLLPKDEGALWKIICRRACDWEKSFILQYENLQYWLISARNVLCTYKGPHTMSLEDVELQARYCIFLIGLHTVPDSSFHAECFQNGRSPYRPFGVRASIALLCLVFEGVQAAEIKGYESANIWACDHGFLSTMFDRLQQSPLFQSEYSMQRLQSAILRLQQAFQEEEIRVASVTPQIINFASQTEVLGYYRQAFLALDPMLLPDILAVMESATETSVSSRKHRLLDMKDRLDRVTLAFQLADMFHGTCPVECLDLAFKKVAALRQSKPDEIVVSEMFHVREFEKDYRGNILAPFYVFAFHVSL